MSERESLWQSLRQNVEAARRDCHRNEATWFWTPGRWELYAGFFKGFGLGFDVFGGEFTVTLGCFAFGGVRG